MLIRVLSEFQPKRGSDIAVKNCLNLSHRRMVQELLTSNNKIAQFHHQGVRTMTAQHLSFIVEEICGDFLTKLPNFWKICNEKDKIWRIWQNNGKRLEKLSLWVCLFEENLN